MLMEFSESEELVESSEELGVLVEDTGREGEAAETVPCSREGLS